jgi:hypothetical protein
MNLFASICIGLFSYILLMLFINGITLNDIMYIKRSTMTRG